MSTIYRLDNTGEIKSYRETAEGFLDLNLSFSKVGPLEYQRSDGRIETEYLTEEELFNEESLITATGKPVTFMHPPEGMITKDNVRRHSRGSTGTKIIKDTPFATILATIHDAELIDVIKSGRARQVSAGYNVEVVKKADGKLYQQNRIYNHFSVVPAGRAGSDVRVHYDSSETDLNVGSNNVSALHTAAILRHKTPLRLSKESRETVPRVKKLPNETGPFTHLRKQG